METRRNKVKLTKTQLRRIIKEETENTSLVDAIQPLIDANQFLKGNIVKSDDLIQNNKYVLYASGEALKHIKDRHRNPNAPGSLMNPGLNLRKVIERVLKTSPTHDEGGMVKWEGVPGNIGKLGLATASPEEIEKMQTYTMPGGKEKVKIFPGKRKDAEDLTLVTALLGKVPDGRRAISLITMFPGGMDVDGVVVPRDRNEFADAGLYFILPPNSPVFKEKLQLENYKNNRKFKKDIMRITKSQLKKIIKEEIENALKEGDDSLQVKYDTWDELYDQTEWTLNVNGEDMVFTTTGGFSSVKSAAEELASRVIEEVFDKDSDELPEHFEKVKKSLMQDTQFAKAVRESNEDISDYADSMHAERYGE